jgi:hypothetical protein
MPVWTFGASFGLAMPISELYEGCEWIHLPPSSSKTLAFFDHHTSGELALLAQFGLCRNGRR